MSLLRKPPLSKQHYR